MNQEIKREDTRAASSNHPLPSITRESPVQFTELSGYLNDLGILNPEEWEVIDDVIHYRIDRGRKCILPVPAGMTGVWLGAELNAALYERALRLVNTGQWLLVPPEVAPELVAMQETLEKLQERAIELLGEREESK